MLRGSRPFVIGRKLKHLASPAITIAGAGCVTSPNPSHNQLSHKIIPQASRSHFFSTSTAQYASIDYSHVVIGGGVVGTAIAAQILADANSKSSTTGSSVLLLERHDILGSETSARNSGVIHAGLYFSPDSLRTKLCIKGKHMLYEAAKTNPIELKQCGKWIVAQNAKQEEYLAGLLEKGKSLGVCIKLSRYPWYLRVVDSKLITYHNVLQIPLEFVSLEKAKQLEPAVRAQAAILNSPSTGIVDAHSLITYSESQIQKYGGDIALNSSVVGIDYNEGTRSYSVHVETSDGETLSLETENVINAAGHYATNISNMVLPKERHVKAYFAKGNYFAYQASHPKVSRLIYPCPSDYASLGTHLTIDLGGQIKFGPDLEWVESADDLAVNAKNLAKAIETVSEYMVGLDPVAFQPDYAGIRPKIVPDGRFQDFIIREEEGFPGFVNLLNIESPGLTSSLAIGEYVSNIYNGQKND